jgi:hypothetical protein
VRVTDPDFVDPEVPPPPPSGVNTELMLGISVGLEPQASFIDDTASGVVITRSSSWWNRTRCQTCGQTFRRGDPALVDSAARTALHLVPGLDCGADPGSSSALSSADRDAFAVGMLSTWPANVPVSRLAPSDWRLPRRGSPREAPTCLYCGHTFRAGEYLVICPCQPGQPACAAAVHRDPAAGLPCWDRWQPTGRLAVCPTTLAKL